MEGQARQCHCLRSDHRGLPSSRLGHGERAGRLRARRGYACVAARDSRARRRWRSGSAARRLAVDRPALWRCARQAGRHHLRSVEQCDGGHGAARGARAGLRCAGRADGDGQHLRRRAGDGGRPRLCALHVQPRHAGGAPDWAPASSPTSTRRPWKTASSPPTSSWMRR